MKTKISFEIDGLLQSTDLAGEEGAVTNESFSISREAETGDDQQMIRMAIEDLISKIQPCRLFGMLASIITHFSTVCPEQINSLQEQEMIDRANDVVGEWEKIDSYHERDRKEQ